MKRLTLIRHAESSHEFPLLGDFERPLSPRGRRDAPVMAQRLATELAPPFSLVSSPALRAITTAEVFAEALGLTLEDIRIEPRIYDATAGTLLHLVNSLDDRNNHVLMFGHNPGFTDLAQLFAAMPFTEMPPCAIVSIGFPMQSWSDLVPDSGELMAFRYPKDGPD